MNSTTYSHISQAWQFIEETSMRFDSEAIQSLRVATSKDAHAPELMSSSQAAFLRMQAQLVSARNVLLIGVDSGIEIPALIDGMRQEGQLTVVTPSSASAQRTREIFDSLRSTRTRMRYVSSDVPTFLHRLNAHDYDIIIVSSQAENYITATQEAQRLLRAQGILILTDAMAMTDDNSQGGVPNPADRHDKAVALRTIIDELMSNEKYDATLLAIGTGLLMAVVRD
ncbi:O-methyltransferase [Alloscardovia omnicolens]|uniref:O-methyltransferase n=1 Tax=Alloscardovia omnicolens TaxID=419015 RepID=UPI003A79E052